MLGLLVLLALALITVSFRESSDGPLHDAQGAVASALQPLEVGVERVARPFRDAYGWTKDLFNARSENEQLRAENELLQQQVIQNESALQQNVVLKRLLDYRDSPSFPADYDGVAAEVIARPSSAVRAGDRRLGRLRPTASRSTPRSSPRTASSARSPSVTERRRARPPAHRRVERRLLRRPAHSARPASSSTASPGDSLVLDRVSKKEVVHVGDEIVTAGWRAGGSPRSTRRGSRSAASPSSAGSAPISGSRC